MAAHSLPVSEPNVNVRPDTREHAAELGGRVGGVIVVQLTSGFRCCTIAKSCLLKWKIKMF